MKIRIKKIPLETELNARHWNHKHQLGGYSTVFDKYNKYNEEKQLYFDTLPIVNEQAGIGRIDLPEVTVTAPDPSIWWTPDSNILAVPNIHGEPGLLKDIYTFMGEMAPSSLVAFGPLALNTLKGLIGKEIVKQLIASEIGGRTVDLASNATTGRTFGLNVGNVIEGITEWNPRNTILGTLITDGMNPGYGLSGKALASKNINLAMPMTRAIDSKVRDSSIMEGLSTLWNNGKIVQKNIPYDPQKYYRIVGKDAIKDAKNTGLIRGGLEFPDGPYFSKGKNVWNVNNGDYVIEGGPNISWIDAKKYNALYQHSNFGENVINGINTLKPKGWQGGIQLLTGNEKALTEAMPYYMQSTKVPSDFFTYWQNHPIIGWRLHSFNTTAISKGEPKGLTNWYNQVKGVFDKAKNFRFNITKPDNYYRIVGLDAIEDAMKRGAVVGSLYYPEGPYFSKGSMFWNIAPGKYVMEATPKSNIDFINASRYRTLDPAIIRGIDNGTIDPNKYLVNLDKDILDGIEFVKDLPSNWKSIEGFPWYQNSTNKTPLSRFNVYKKLPIGYYRTRLIGDQVPMK